MSRSFKEANPLKLPDCWGHRGASAAYPENTLASFQAAIHDGSEGIESDVHVSLDDVVIMFHDPSLNRTTNMTGLIRQQRWYGPEGIEQARTKREPQQSIPTFSETVALLMQRDNRHVIFNVDVKVYNDSERLFRLMHKTISAQEDWQNTLAPRIVLGLWHPRFIEAAKKYLPYCRRSHIGQSPYIAREYFWNDCEAFSMSFDALATSEGDKFRRECQKAGKRLMVWTVNDRRQMMEAVRWQVNTIITDDTRTWLDLRESLYEDYAKADGELSRTFLWTSPLYWTPVQIWIWRGQRAFLEKNGGPIESTRIVQTVAAIGA